jgi:multicomponent Na+:H+ antiporter subunit E
MTFALFAVILAIGWAAATGSFAVGNLLLGALIAVAALLLVRRQIARPGLIPRTLRILSLGWLFLVELMLSAIRVAALVLRPDMRVRLRPAFVAFPLTVTRDAEITLLANLITLTPGTLSVDVSEDRKLLYVHAIDVADRDALVRDIADGFERKIIEAFR